MRTRMHSTGTERARCGTQHSALTTLQELKKTIEQWEREREEVGVLVAQLKENMESKAAKLKDMARPNMQHLMQRATCNATCYATCNATCNATCYATCNM